MHNSLQIQGHHLDQHQLGWQILGEDAHLPTDTRPLSWPIQLGWTNMPPSPKKSKADISHYGEGKILYRGKVKESKRKAKGLNWIWKGKVFSLRTEEGETKKGKNNFKGYNMCLVDIKIDEKGTGGENTLEAEEDTDLFLSSS
jgi:hypothetical protein